MTQTDRQTIEAWLTSNGYEAETWVADEDGEGAMIGRFRVIEDVDDEMGPFEGDEGDVRVSVVGAEEYGTRHIHVGLTCDGMEEIECPIVVLEEID